jgi:hypothetical protein
MPCLRRSHDFAHAAISFCRNRRLTFLPCYSFFVFIQRGNESDERQANRSTQGPWCRTKERASPDCGRPRRRDGQLGSFGHERECPCRQHDDDVNLGCCEGSAIRGLLRFVCRCRSGICNNRYFFVDYFAILASLPLLVSVPPVWFFLPLLLCTT